MPSYTVRIAIDTEAPNPWEAVGNVKYALKGIDHEYRVDVVTDEDGEEVTPIDTGPSPLGGTTRSEAI